MFFNTKNYKANLMRSAAKVSKTKKPHSYEDEIAKAEYNISLICNKRNLLHNNELNYIFDFLLEMCKYAQTNEYLAISIGTHLIPDFFEKS